MKEKISLEEGEEKLFIKILLQPALILKRIGFELDELDLVNNKNYVIRKVKENSLSENAGLRAGDKIVRINEKETKGMNYITFCNEILIAKEHYKFNNLLRLIIIRKPVNEKKFIQQSKKFFKKYKLAHSIISKTILNDTDVKKENNNFQRKLFNSKKHLEPVSKQFQKDKPIKPIKPTSNIIYNHESTNNTQNVQANKIDHPSQAQHDDHKKENNIPQEFENELNTYRNLSHENEHKTQKPQLNRRTPSPIIMKKVELFEKAPIKVENLKEFESRPVKSPVNNILHEVEQIIVPPPLPFSPPPDSVTHFSILQNVSNDVVKSEPMEDQANKKESTKQYLAPMIPEIEGKRDEQINFNISSIRPISPAHSFTDSIEFESKDNLQPTTLNEEIEKGLHLKVSNENKIEEPEISFRETPVEKSESSIDNEPEAVNEIKDLKNHLKVYRIEKTKSFFGFGIILHTEKSENDEENETFFPLVEIEKGSPAQMAGLKSNQRIIAVDGYYINSDLKTVEELAQLIDRCYYENLSSEVVLIDSEIWDRIKDNDELMLSLFEILESSLNKTLTSEVDNTSQANMSEIKNNLIEPDLRIENNEVQREAVPENATKPEPQIDTPKELVIKPKYVTSTIPRFCHLIRQSKDDQYGFDFKTVKNETKHIATNVRDGFPAQAAGLKNGDFILEINLTPVEALDHEEVVNIMYTKEKEVTLLVVEDLKGYKNILMEQEKIVKPIKSKLTRQSSTVSSNDKNVSYHEVILMETYQGIGLHLATDGRISYIEPFSPAELSGLQKDQKLLYVNNVAVKDMSIPEIAKVIRENSRNLIIGVEVKESNEVSFSIHGNESEDEDEDDRDNTENAADQKVDNQNQTNEVNIGQENQDSTIKSDRISSLIYENITPSNAEEQNQEDQRKTRSCNLVVRPDFHGFGFVLKKNKTAPHEIANIIPNSPAALSGIEEGDYLLKINDVSVLDKEYQQLVVLIKNGMNSLNGLTKLEVIRPEFYVNIEPEIPENIKPIKSSSVKSNDYFKNESFKNRSVQSLPEYSNISEINDQESEDSPDANRDTSNVKQSPNKAVSLNNLNRDTLKSDKSSTLASKKNDKASTMSLNTLKNSPKFKRCTLVISANYQGFGFKINKEVKPKYMISGVERNSPAARANINEKDVLVEINSKNIRQSKFDKVRTLLGEAVKKGRVELLVISMEGYLWFKSKKKKFSQKLATADNVEYFSTENNPEKATVSNVIQNNYESMNFETANKSFNEASVDEELIPITIRKKSPNTSYGMTLSVPKPNLTKRSSFPIVTSVEIGSPAEESGLKKTDEIVEVNGNKTFQQTDAKVTGFIRNSDGVLQLLVRRNKENTEVTPTIQNQPAAENSTDQGLKDKRDGRQLIYENLTDDENNENTQPDKIEISSSKIQVDSKSLEDSNSAEPVPRLCRVRAYESTLGFVVLASKKKLGVFKVSEIVPNSSAYHSGLRNGDFVIEINGINVQSMSYQDLIKLIKAKKEDDNLQMLVADETTLEWYSKRNTPINSSMVKKITYIETILQEEMDKNVVDSSNTTNRESQSSFDSNNKIDTNET